MMQYYFLNGKMVPAEQARLHVSDLATLRGFGIFDYFLVRHGQPLFLQDYLHRFYNSAEKLALAVPVSQDILSQQIAELIQANGHQQAGIHLLLTGGYASDRYTPTQPNLIIMEEAFKAPPQVHYSQGIHLMTYEHQRELPEIKSINYLTGIHILPLLRQQGADHVLYHDGSHVRESDRSNFFGITRDGVLVTPKEKILAGITRKHVLQLARQEGMEVEEREMTIAELAELREAFLSSSTKGVMPVVRIDGQTVGNGRPGPLTQGLEAAFRQWVADTVGTQL